MIVSHARFGHVDLPCPSLCIDRRIVLIRMFGTFVSIQCLDVFLRWRYHIREAKCVIMIDFKVYKCFF